MVGATIHGATVTAVNSALASLDLAGVLAEDLAELEAQVHESLSIDARLASLGVELVGVRFTVLRPDPDVEKALQTPSRELIQQKADRATYERRATAVEREAAIGENELANQIELAKRQERLIEQKGANDRRRPPPRTNGPASRPTTGSPASSCWPCSAPIWPRVCPPSSTSC